ncbi:gamma-glutamyl-gamma-aminobutyrate hydrolase family protein [Frigoribacterium sp. ME-P-080]|uniref:gamma-glutamyl-gamma-aminobutyrate hydrolase family protein n=1 Tax=Frigoribacterium sp. ME-P-080 TaxID=3040289 RepID=UPI00254AF353|nr:gamma-glutamyl-gamma-aminobutyrate hydrolase family protein [Frigoribacterium sp. ME-P-080]
MSDSPAPRLLNLLLLDVTDEARDDPAFERELDDLSTSVVAAAEQVGFTVRRVPANRLGDVRAALAEADAVLVTGGEDVDPSHYGGPLDHPGRGQTFADADRVQIEVVRGSVEARLPLVGICRGMQVVDVALGGDLVQHLEHPGHVNPDDVSDSMVDHPVRLADDSTLASMLGTTSLVVRSSHHQAVGRLGEGLRAVAWADDGTVEAVEHVTAPVWCVQWHPEDRGATGTVLTDLLVAARDAALGRAGDRSRRTAD